MTSADRTSSLARLQPLTTYCDDECAHKRCSQARRQSINGGCSPSGPASFTTNNDTFERTPPRSSNEHTLTRTALHLGSETLKLFLCIFSLPKKYNQTILFLPVHSYSSSTRSPRTHRASDDDVVCGPLSSLRGPGLHLGRPCPFGCAGWPPASPRKSCIAGPLPAAGLRSSGPGKWRKSPHQRPPCCCPGKSLLLWAVSRYTGLTLGFRTQSVEQFV